MKVTRIGLGPRNSYYPLARKDGLRKTEADNKVLVYDTLSHHIHHLDEACTAVWAHCNGMRTPKDIAIATRIEQDRVQIALRELDDRNLLVGYQPAMHDQPRLSRRKLAKFAGVGLPTIISISAPIAAAASSCEGPTTTGCLSEEDCCPIKRQGMSDIPGYCDQDHPDLPGVCMY